MRAITICSILVGLVGLGAALFELLQLGYQADASGAVVAVPYSALGLGAIGAWSLGVGIVLEARHATFAPRGGSRAS